MLLRPGSAGHMAGKINKHMRDCIDGVVLCTLRSTYITTFEKLVFKYISPTINCLYESKKRLIRIQITSV